MANNRTLTILLFAISIVAALAIGVAGTLWLTRSSPPLAPAANASAANPPSSAGAASSAATAQAGGDSTPGPSPNGAQLSASTGVFINQREVTTQQLEEIKRMYGAAPPSGRYWYDPRSGLYGVWGHEAAGYIRPGHDFGPLPEDSSAGNTGVFINGRHINMTEAMFFQRIFGAVYQGRWWLDGQTGNVGMEGNPTPIANLVLALQQAQQRGGGGGYRWRDEINRASGGAEGGCVWVNMPGSSYSSSGCD